MKSHAVQSRTPVTFLQVHNTGININQPAQGRAWQHSSLRLGLPGLPASPSPPILTEHTSPERICTEKSLLYNPESFLLVSPSPPILTEHTTPEQICTESHFYTIQNHSSWPGHPSHPHSPHQPRADLHRKSLLYNPESFLLARPALPSSQTTPAQRGSAQKSHFYIIQNHSSWPGPALPSSQTTPAQRGSAQKSHFYTIQNHSSWPGQPSHPHRPHQPREDLHRKVTFIQSRIIPPGQASPPILTDHTAPERICTEWKCYTCSECTTSSFSVPVDLSSLPKCLYSFDYSQYIQVNQRHRSAN
ncbi:uncharacterized protein LOC134553962 [Prinia subflava]|uniref:uncharacterized protein LOC134553962 n=1 Tax=Prinia subflava TaxID=208062 RepID=UPI002FE3DE3E